jgi:hypothetical protein
MKPNRRVRLKSATNGGGATVQWHGFLDTLVAVPREGGANEAMLEAFGPLAKVNARKAYVAPAADVLTGQAITNILDAIAFPAADRAIDTGETTMARHFVPGLFGVDAMRRVEETEGGFVRETRDAEIAFDDRHHRLKEPYLTSQVTYSDASGAAIFYQAVPQTDPTAEIVNVIRAKVIRQIIAPIATLWTLPESGVNSPSIRVGESITFIAQYPTPDAPKQNIGVAVWTTPAPTTDYTAASEPIGGSDQTADVGVAVVKAVETMEITFTNNGAAVIHITKLDARGTALQGEHEVWVQHKDTASIADFDEREYVLPAEFLPDTNQARDFCIHIATLHASETAIIQIKYTANETQAAMDDDHVRNISDRVTLVANGLTGLGIPGNDFFVERKEDSIARGGEHTVRLDLSEVSTAQGSPIILDTGPGLDTGTLTY